MTLEEVYYVSQIAAAVAIFASLIFVGLQMRAQAREARYSTMNQILTDFHQLTTALSSDPIAAQDWYTAHREGLAGVAPERRAALVMVVINVLHLYERAYIQRKANRLGDDAWHLLQRGNAGNIVGKATQEIWQLRKSAFALDFVAYLDKEIAGTQPVSYAPLSWGSAAPGQPSSSES